jgi:hypothetical protein
VPGSLHNVTSRVRHLLDEYETKGVEAIMNALNSNLDKDGQEMAQRNAWRSVASVELQRQRLFKPAASR